jgi:hypothetical protein
MSDQISAPQAPAAPESAPQAALDVNTIAQRIDAKNVPQAPVSPQQEAAKVAEAKKIKQLQLKVYGQDVVEELPFEITDDPKAVEYLTKQLQLSKAAQRAMQEKGSYETKVNSFLQNLQGNTAETLRQMNIDPVEFAAKVLEAEIEKQKLSPEQRRVMELEQKLKATEEEAKRKEQEAQKKEFEAHRKQVAERVENQMIQALDKSDLPHTPYVADRIAKYMLLALNDPSGPVELTPEDVIPLVREDMLRDIQHVIKGMKEDKIEEFVGKDVFSKVRKKNIEKLKVQTPATAKSAIKEVAQPQKPSLKDKDVPKMAAKDFFKLMS